jgi:hypothetical protein
MKAEAPDPVEALFGELVRAGERPAEIRAVLERSAGDPVLLTAVLRRPLSARVLEIVGTSPPWSGDPRLLAAIALNPRSPRGLSQRLLPSLFWRDLADVASSPRVEAAVRVRAEALLMEVIPDLRVGERITLARLATPRVLKLLLADAEERVVAACLLNPRLTEEDLLVAIRQTSATRALLQAVPASTRWAEVYAVRMGLVLQPRTPLGVAMGQLTSLLTRDLQRVAQASELPALVQTVARALVQERSGRPGSGQEGREDE